MNAPSSSRSGIQADQTLDCFGLRCPIPVRKTAEVLAGMAPGRVLHVIATDDWFGPDLEAWLRGRPHTLLKFERRLQEFHAYLRRG